MIEARTLEDVPLTHAMNMQNASECVARFHGLQDWVREAIGYDGDEKVPSLKARNFFSRGIFSREWWRAAFTRGD